MIDQKSELLSPVQDFRIQTPEKGEGPLVHFMSVDSTSGQQLSQKQFKEGFCETEGGVLFVVRSQGVPLPEVKVEDELLMRLSLPELIRKGAEKISAGTETQLLVYTPDEGKIISSFRRMVLRTNFVVARDLEDNRFVVGMPSPEMLARLFSSDIILEANFPGKINVPGFLKKQREYVEQRQKFIGELTARWQSIW